MLRNETFETSLEKNSVENDGQENKLSQPE